MRLNDRLAVTQNLARFLRGSLLLAAICLGIALPSLAFQEPVKPLPELREFLAEVRKGLRSDRLLLSQYTYTAKTTERHLDKRGDVKKTETAVYEIYPSLEEDLTYRRLVSKNGQPVSEKELRKQDEKHNGKLRKRARQLGREGLSERERRLAKEAEERRKEDQEIDEMFRLYDFQMEGREEMAGVSAIVVRFAPRPDFKARSDAAKILKKISGRAWVCEADKQVVRVEAELLETVSLGLGILARLGKGARLTFQRRRVNDEIWLPAEARYQIAGRILLFKGVRVESTTEFFDYRKFTVDTSISFGEVKDP